jgi:hypothetical protein
VSSVARQTQRPSVNDPAGLVNGDRLRQAEFHRRYQAYPEDTRFELIAGTVYMASPLKLPHGSYHFLLNWLFGSYAAETLGVQGLDNTTVILDDKNEPQPDLTLRLLSNCGGKSSVTKDGYLQGPPELIAEIAHSTRALDLHQKKDAYCEAGIQEYLVLSVEEREVAWFDFRARRTLVQDSEGICRSRVFPGLWLAVPALLDQRQDELMATLRAGLQSPAHTSFVKRLKARGRGKK